jgi:glycosyltransferase involved in cell wall biosynthesis
MTVAVDAKNLALFGGGIASFLKPILAGWIECRPELDFCLVGPRFDLEELSTYPNCRLHPVSWPSRLPRALRHPIYDNVLFPAAMRRLRPQFIFSPYHDVRLPSGVGSAMTIHDTCIGDLKNIYPARVRYYYEGMLRANLQRASDVVTVSEASRQSILRRYAVQPERVHVIYNTLDRVYSAPEDNSRNAQAIRGRWKAGLLVFYAGGSEYRKNLENLLAAIGILAAEGHDPLLLVTGDRDARWQAAISRHIPSTADRVRFVGRLDLRALRFHYEAADVAVYPSLCEGFGRPCLEAGALGVPVACSDLSVFREILGDEAFYFDPADPRAMAGQILAASQAGSQPPRLDSRFSREVVVARFVELMDAIMAKGAERA